MKRSMLYLALLVCTLWLSPILTLHAQVLPFAPSIYAGGLLGSNVYGGDRDLNPSNDVSSFVEDIGATIGFEVGYQLTPNWTFFMSEMSGNYPQVDTDIIYDLLPRIDPNTTSAWRHHVNLMTRYYVVPQGRVVPYVQAGANVSFGKTNGETRTGAGPIVGLGVEIPASRALSVFLEYDTMRVFGDEAMDLADPGTPADKTDSDAFTFFGFGARYKLKLFP